ncbi:hypothetical protein ACI2OX_19325 [Bacillus sp. N9]
MNCIVVHHIDDVIQSLNGQAILPMVIRNQRSSKVNDEPKWSRIFNM